ncbi:hypothetical protein PFISCL1PPCAC_6763, partial [Pristionchus fissidentatus]
SAAILDARISNTIATSIQMSGGNAGNDYGPYVMMISDMKSGVVGLEREVARMTSELEQKRGALNHMETRLGDANPHIYSYYKQMIATIIAEMIELTKMITDKTTELDEKRVLLSSFQKHYGSQVPQKSEESRIAEMQSPQSTPLQQPKQKSVASVQPLVGGQPIHAQEQQQAQHLQQTVQHMQLRPPPLLPRTKRSDDRPIVAPKPSLLFRVENGEITPIDGVNPFTLLDPVISQSKKLSGDVSLLSAQLHNEFLTTEKETFNSLTRSFGKFTAIPPCNLCNRNPNSTNVFIDHITGKLHVSNMEKINASYCADAYNFWMQVIRFSRKDGGQIMLKQTMEHPRIRYSADKIRRLREATVNPSFFKPSFFCPDAFKLSKVANSNVLDSVARICQAGERQIERPSVELIGPLALLAPCDKEEKKLPGNVEKQLTQLWRAYKKCNRPALFVATADTVRECRPDFDHFYNNAPVKCVMCLEPVGSANSLIEHVTSPGHINQILELETGVSAEAFNFWLEAIRAAPSLYYTEEKRKDSTSVPPRKLFRFEDEQVSPIEGVDPFTLLDPINSASNKMKGDVAKLAEDLNDLYLVRGVHCLPKITHSFSGRKEPRVCRLCNCEVASLFSVLILHVTGDEHIANMKKKGVNFCADAYTFWQQVIEFSIKLEEEKDFITYVR